MRFKKMAVWTTLFCFCLALGGCGGGFREVRRETQTTEYYLAPDGSRIDPKIIQDAIARKDWSTLQKYSWLHNPESIERVAKTQEALPVFYESYGKAGKKYLRIGADPVVKGGWSDKDLPKGHFWIGLPGDAFARVTSKSKKVSEGLLRKGEEVAVHLVIKNGQPVFDSQKGILTQAAAVKRCANQILNEILIWLPVGVFQTIYQNQLMILSKVAETKTLIYLEKDNKWMWWVVGAGLAVGLGAGLLAGRHENKIINNYNTTNTTTTTNTPTTTTTVVITPPPPPPRPPVNPPCPPSTPSARPGV